ncbi:MAG: hypothetical protein U5R49_11915 [Deltaproteobacteria bacterium]|nr:hypothetical protein [Deltaproteobacteria bacterium]
MDKPASPAPPISVHYRLAGEAGDLSTDSAELSLPFRLTPEKIHPFLTLGDYFEAIESFLLRDQGSCLTLALQEKLKRAIGLENISSLLIRSEKHGVLYHIAGIEMFLNDDPVKLTVSTALSTIAKTCLKREYVLLQGLGRVHELPYLPAVFAQGEVPLRARDKGDSGSGEKALRGNFAMVLSDWFEGFHEWHITPDNAQNRQQIRLWDPREERRYLSASEVYQLFKEASKILTFYYDPATSRHIYPWHHAAGDFVVRIRADTLQVRLVTVRKYASIMDAFSTESMNPLIALVYFFLNLTIRMRLDRADGVGDTVWIADFAVSAVIEGFFEAITHMVREATFTLCDQKSLLSLLRSFAPSELKLLFQSLYGLYEGGDPEEYAIMKDQLERHITFLHQALQEFPG